jgi:hypothetical protein
LSTWYLTRNNNNTGRRDIDNLPVRQTGRVRHSVLPSTTKYITGILYSGGHQNNSCEQILFYFLFTVDEVKRKQ